MGIPAFNPPLPFARPKLPSFSLLMDRFKNSWEEASLTKGLLTGEYEAAVARHVGVPHAIAVSSCTTGLILATGLSTGLSPNGDCPDQSLLSQFPIGECLVPSFTFTSTITALLWNNLQPVFVDCHPRKFTLDLDSLSRMRTERTALVVATYVFGNPPPLAELQEFCARYKLPLLLDAAHGFGTNYAGQPAGSHGILEVFSTSATKLLCTGEGGVVVTKDTRLAETLRSLREYGHGENYETVHLGLNGRLTEFQSLMGLDGLKLLEDHANRRNHLAALYQKALRDLPVSFQEIEPKARSSYKDFAVLLEGEWASKRDSVADELLKEGIPTRKYFYPPIHRQRFFAGSDKKPVSLPATESICARILCLPMFYDLREEQIEKIGDVLHRIYKKVS